MDGVPNNCQFEKSKYTSLTNCATYSIPQGPNIISRHNEISSERWLYNKKNRAQDL